MDESLAVVMSSLERMDAWKILVIGIVGYLVIKLLFRVVGGIVALFIVPWGWKAKLKNFRDLKHVECDDEGVRIPFAKRLLGLAVLFLSLGAGIVLSLVIPMISGWGVLAVMLLAFGGGLVVYYVIASRATGGSKQPL